MTDKLHSARIADTLDASQVNVTRDKCQRERKGHCAIVSARDRMTGTLGSFRNTLEDLGGGLGVADPVSGPVVKTQK
jgi:hypothetical protein